MVTVLVTSFLLLVVISLAIYRWQRVTLSDVAKRPLPPSSNFEGLFAEAVVTEQARLDAAQSKQDLEKNRKDILLRAETGDNETLSEAHNTGDENLYEEVLNTLVRRAENDKQVLALASYIQRSSLPLSINVTLAESFTKIWKHSPDRHTTAEMLHVAALAGDVAFYQKAIGLVMQHWRAQQFRDISAEELIALFESEFWLISSTARNSGSGFLLKRELAKIRHELNLKP